MQNCFFPEVRMTSSVVESVEFDLGVYTGEVVDSRPHGRGKLVPIHQNVLHTCNFLRRALKKHCVCVSVGRFEKEKFPCH